MGVAPTWSPNAFGTEPNENKKEAEGGRGMGECLPPSSLLPLRMISAVELVMCVLLLLAQVCVCRTTNKSWIPWSLLWRPLVSCSP